MIDLLTPPPEQDLPPARAADIRRVVMRSAGATRRHRSVRTRWLLVPAVAALVLVGGVVGLRPGPAPSVLGSPGPAPSTSSPSVPVDANVDTDAGPLSRSEAVAVIDEVRDHRHAYGPASRPAPLADVLVARRTTTALGDGTFVVWTDTAGSTWWAEDIPGVMGTSGPVSGPAAKRDVREPDAAHPVVRLTDPDRFSWFEDADRPDATARDLAIGAFYLVSASVDRVEVRMTVEGARGPWFTAPVHAGYTFIPAVTPGRHSTSDRIDKVTTIEDRAFDSDGNRVPIVQS
ncbi:MAG TPA: hypothetical protein VGC37_02640 [Friedmanniella sp.]